MAIGLVKKPPRKTVQSFRQLLGNKYTGITPVAAAPPPPVPEGQPNVIDMASNGVQTRTDLAMQNRPTPIEARTEHAMRMRPTPEEARANFVDPRTAPVTTVFGETPGFGGPATGIDIPSQNLEGSGKTQLPTTFGRPPGAKGPPNQGITPSTPDSTNLAAATAAAQATQPLLKTPVTQPMTPEQIATAGAAQQAGALAPTGVQPNDMQPPMQPGQVGTPGQPGVATGGAPSTTADLIGQFQQQHDLANQANEARYGQMMNLYDQILGVYGPGGGFGAGMLSDIERTKQRDIQGATQALVSSGLYGTTRTAALGPQWEREVGQQARLNLGDQLAQRYTGALEQKAGAIERREDVAPSPELMAGLVTGAEAGPGGTGAGAGGAGGSGVGGAGGGAGTGTGAGAVDISQYWETGQFSPSTAVRAFSSASPADQETFLRQGVKRINNMGQKVQNKETKLADLRTKVEAEDDPKKKQKLQRQITKLENELANFTQKRDTAQGTYDEMLRSRQLAAQAYGAGGAVGEYAQSQAAMREYQQMMEDQQRLADEEAARRAEEIRVQAYAPYEAAARRGKEMAKNLRTR